MPGPKVMVINEYAGSGGDAMPWLFQRAEDRSARRHAHVGRPRRDLGLSPAHGRRQRDRRLLRRHGQRRQLGRRERGRRAPTTRSSSGRSRSSSAAIRSSRRPSSSRSRRSRRTRRSRRRPTVRRRRGEAGSSAVPPSTPHRGREGRNEPFRGTAAGPTDARDPPNETFRSSPRRSKGEPDRFLAAGLTTNSCPSRRRMRTSPSHRARFNKAPSCRRASEYV